MLLVEVRVDGSGGTIELMKLSLSRFFFLRSLLGRRNIYSRYGRGPGYERTQKEVSSLFCTEGGVHEKIRQLK